MPLDRPRRYNLRRVVGEARRLIEGEKGRSDRLDCAEATARYIRNVGFTTVNRFAALRAMEVRGFLSKETLVRRAEYGGRSLRERDVAEARPGRKTDDE